MTETHIWGEQAVADAMATLRRVPARPTQQTPLDQEVAELAESALARDGDGDVVIGDLDRSWFADVALILVDAVLTRDKSALDRLDALLRRVHRVLVIAREESSDITPDRLDTLRRWQHWLQLTMEYVRAALERIAPVAAAAAAKGTHYERFLRVVAEHPGINSRKIRKLIDADRSSSSVEPTGSPSRPMDEGQLSKIGGKLRAQGLVFAERSRHGLAWELTPRGRLVVNRLLGAHENPDHPVDCMLIAINGVRPETVAARLSEATPREVTVLRPDDIVTYQRRGPLDEPQPAPARKPASVARRGMGTGGSRPPVAIKTAVDDLLNQLRPKAPTLFAMDNGVVYEQTNRRSSRKPVRMGR